MTDVHTAHGGSARYPAYAVGAGTVSLGGSVDKEKQDGEVIALSAATLIVYKQVMGAEMPPNDAPETNAIMHDVAHALSNVAPIYGARRNAQCLKPLPVFDLMHGAFQRGATVLRTPKGIEYQKLFIRRDDLWLAIARLKGVKFKAGRRLNKS